METFYIVSYIKYLLKQISPNNEGRQHVACFARGIKGGPASVKIFPRGRYKNTDKLTNKSFYKADKATLRWNNRGNAVLAIALQDDGTGMFTCNVDLDLMGYLDI